MKKICFLLTCLACCLFAHSQSTTPLMLKPQLYLMVDSTRYESGDELNLNEILDKRITVGADQGENMSQQTASFEPVNFTVLLSGMMYSCYGNELSPQCYTALRELHEKNSQKPLSRESIAFLDIRVKDPGGTQVMLAPIVFELLTGNPALGTEDAPIITAKVDQIIYKLDPVSKTAMVHRISSEIVRDTITKITIPDEVNYKNVTYRVTSIGGRALWYCTSLTSPVYNAHVFAFMPTSYSGEYTIPDGIESIASGAFSECRGLTSVTIPNSVTSIGDEAFSECIDLASVKIPSSVTSIGNEAFSECYGLTSVSIPNSVTSIGDHAFYDCFRLTSPVHNAHVFAFMPPSYSGKYTIPDGIESIASGAFSECRGLTSVTIPNSVTSIGDEAFSECTGLASVKIPNSVTSIGANAFYGCSSLTSVKIPNSVTSIGEKAFSECNSLKSVAIPNSVTSIGNGAFYNCESLTSIEIPNSVTSIGEEAFSECIGLTTVRVPKGVEMEESSFPASAQIIYY